MSDVKMPVLAQRGDVILKVTVILFIVVVYLSWFTWLASTVGGLAVFAFYYLPVAHAAVAAAVARRAGRVKAPPGSAMLAGGGIAFVVTFVVAHQLLAAGDQYSTTGRAAVGTGVVNLIGVIAGVCLAFTLLDAPTIFARPVTLAVFVCLAVDALLTYRLVQTDPLASRLLATPSGVMTYGATGASGFYIANSVALLLPAMLTRTKQGRPPYVWWFALVASIAFIYTCGYLLAITAALIGFGAYAFFMARREIKLLLVATGGIAIAVVTIPSVAVSILTWLSDRTAFYELSRRLSDLANLVNTGASNAPSLDRLLLYQDSWGAFLLSPVFGVFLVDPSFRLSNHSTILDILGGTGLLGFAALTFTVLGAYRMGARILTSRAQLAGLRATYLAAIFVALVNPILNQPAIVFSAIVVAPLICFGTGEERATRGPKELSFRLRGIATMGRRIEVNR